MTDGKRAGFLENVRFPAVMGQGMAVASEFATYEERIYEIRCSVHKNYEIPENLANQAGILRP